MRQLAWVWIMILCVPSIPWAGTGDDLTIAITAKGGATLDRAIAPGGSHEGLTRTQVIQRATNAFLQNLFDQLSAGDSQELDRKLKVATNAAKNNAKMALNAGIDLPVVTTIANQTSNVGQSPTVLIEATDPDGLPLRITATGLPPGLTVSRNAQDQPQITGTLTTAGVFTVEVRANKFSDVYGTNSFVWTVNVP